MSFIQRSPRVQIVSRYIPAENTVGHFTYLLDFMRYLRHAGCKLELIALDSLFGEASIPPEVQEIADVYVRKLPQLEIEVSGAEGLFSKCKALLRPFYMRLPERYLYIMRKIFYRLRRKEMYEAKNWDTLPTREEMGFANIRFTAFHPDVVIANYTFLGGILDWFSANKRVLKAMLTWDIRHQRVTAYKKAGYQSDDSDWTWENESELLRKADVLLAIQKDDAKVLQQMAPQCEVLCAPMSAKYSSLPGDQISGRCMFVGSNVDHNVYGLRWFLKDVWPIILHTLPDSSLCVCGSVCYEIHEDFPNVHLVDNLGPWKEEYATAELCVIPLIVGSGLKIKLVEALSYGRACVSTSVGIQGVQELTDKAVLVADTAEDFAEAVVTLLENPGKRVEMEKQARKYVEEELSPEKVYQPFVDRIYQHVQQNDSL